MSFRDEIDENTVICTNRETEMTRFKNELQLSANYTIFFKRKTNTFRRAERARYLFDGNKCGRPSLVRFGCLVIGSKFISYAAAGH